MRRGGRGDAFAARATQAPWRGAQACEGRRSRVRFDEAIRAAAGRRSRALDWHQPWRRRRSRRDGARVAARLHPARDPGRHDPARGGARAGLLHAARGDRDGRSRRADRGQDRAHARGGELPAPAAGVGHADRVRDRSRYRPRPALPWRARPHPLRRRPARLPGPRRPAPARDPRARRRARPGAGGVVRDGAGRRDGRRARCARAGGAGARPARRALPLPRHRRGRAPGRVDRPLGRGRDAAGTGVGGTGQPQRGHLAAAAGDPSAARRHGAVSRLRAHGRGAALVLVLWLVALMAALIGAFAMTAQTEYLQGRTLDASLVAGQAARAGLDYAVTRVSPPEPRRQWLPDGRRYAWRFGGADVEVRIVDESGKLDLNAAEPASLSALMQVLGVERGRADALAAAIVDWRDA